MKEGSNQERGGEESSRPKPEEKPAKQSQQHPGGTASQKREADDLEKKAFIVRKLKILAVTLHHWWPNKQNRD